MKMLNSYRENKWLTDAVLQAKQQIRYRNRLMGSRDDHNDDLERLFAEYADAIFRYVVLQVGDRDLAKDLTQDAFIKFWQCLERGDEIEHERALLYKIAGNLTIDFFRKKKSVSLDMLLEEGFEPGVDQTENMQTKIEFKRAVTLLHELPETYRQVLTLRYIEGLEPADIAEVLGENANAVSVRIHRGLKQLESLMKNDE